jgi:hypothetical protein
MKDVLMSKSTGEAVDIIGTKLDKYEWAIKKHGLKTITGSLSSVLDNKFIAALATSSGAAGLIGGPIWALLSSGSLVIGKLALHIGDRLIELEDIKRGENSEVAFIYEAKKTFQKKKYNKSLDE